MERVIKPSDGAKISYKTISGCLILAVCLLFLSVLDADIWQILSVGVLGIMVMICLKDISRNCFLLFFLASLFVFLMSGDIAEIIFDEHYYLQFSEETTLHAHKCIFIALLSISVGFFLTPVRRKKIEIDTSENKDGFIVKLKRVSKSLYFISYVILLVSTADIIRFVMVNGYVAYYVSYSSSLPSVIVRIGEYAPLAFCIYLATFPSKKESSSVILSFLLYSGLSLFVGSRSNAIYNTVFILCYCLFRNFTDKGKEVWVSKKLIICLIIAVPFILSFLYLYEFIRTDQEIESITFGESIVSFFVNIGASSKVIKYGYELSGQIPQMKFYSFGETLNYFKYGTLFNLFNQNPVPHRHSVEFAMESHSFGAIVSYLTMPAKFLNGQGTGSSYIAELYADFGYFGVALGSLIYGCFFKKITLLSNKRWLSTAIKLYMFLVMLAAPRATYDGFIAQIVNVNNILYLIFIYLLAKYGRRTYKLQK